MPKQSAVRVDFLEDKSLKKEKAYVMNCFFNKYLENQLNPYHGQYMTIKDRAHEYKYRMNFKGTKNVDTIVTYAQAHSILASLVMDLPIVENESPLVTNLRENWKKIVKFGKNKDEEVLNVENCDVRYKRLYKEMLKHVLVSDANLPNSIDVNSIKKVREDLVYEIRKK